MSTISNAMPADDAILALLRQCEQSGRVEASARYVVATCGPFQAQIDLTTNSPWMSIAIPIAPLGDEWSIAGAVEEVRRTFHAHQRTTRFEFSETLWPALPDALERAGLRLEARQPMMACAPADLRPFAGPHVAVRLLTPADADETLGAFQMIRFEEKLEGDPPYAPRRAIDRLRSELEAGYERFALATLDGRAAGTGVCGLQDGVGEVVGIVTLPAMRRKGVAATVTTFLVQDFFARGGRIAWLSAEDAGAQALYARVGFRLISDWLNFTEAVDSAE